MAWYDFSDFEQDLRELGFYKNTQPLSPARTYAELYTLVDCTRYIGPLATTEQITVQTEIGEKALALCQRNIKFNDNSWFACGSAEVQFQTSLHPDEITNPKRRSAILLTDNDTPVAVIKQTGEVTCYGLEDVPAKGIYAGAISSLGLHPELVHWRLGQFASTEAWHLPIDDVTPAKPIRLSVFCVPVDQRVELDCDEIREEGVLGTSHDGLRARAHQLMRTALSIKFD